MMLATSNSTVLHSPGTQLVIKCASNLHMKSDHIARYFLVAEKVVTGHGSLGHGSLGHRSLDIEAYRHGSLLDMEAY